MPDTWWVPDRGATPDHIPIGRGLDTSFNWLSVWSYHTEILQSCNNTPIVDLCMGF